MDWIINITFVDNIKTYTDMARIFENGTDIEVQFHWDEYEFDDILKEDLGSGFDVKQWSKQNGGILDDMFENIETYLHYAVAQYFGEDVMGSGTGKYHDGEEVIYTFYVDNDILKSRIAEFGDEIDGIQEYSGYYMFYLPNGNGTVDSIFGDYVRDQVDAIYKNDATALRVAYDIVETYMDIVDFSLWKPEPEIVEFLEQYK